MSEFVLLWKKEHLAIQNTLETAIKLDICSEAGQKKMREAKALILKHLQNEDEILYPVLRRAAETNAELKRTLELFGKDMEEIVRGVLSFFSKYDKNPLAEGLSSELGQILAALLTRISREEEIFIKEYESTLS